MNLHWSLAEVLLKEYSGSGRSEWTQETLWASILLSGTLVIPGQAVWSSLPEDDVRRSQPAASHRVDMRQLLKTKLIPS